MPIQRDVVTDSSGRDKVTCKRHSGSGTSNKLITNSAGEPAARNVPVRWGWLTKGEAAAAKAGGRRGSVREHGGMCWVG
jgi:hypothetical protein